MVDLSVDLGGGHRLPNPLMTASGCAANGEELHRFFDVADLGAFVTKSVMADPRSGRGTPRMAETPSGMLNSIGLQGPGIEAFVDDDLPWLASVGARVLPSIAGSSSTEFAHVAATLRASRAFDAVVGVEVNISCPNVANRGLVFACDPMASAKVIALVREQLPRDMPVFAKLSPDVTDITAIAAACVKAGADGLTMINTLLGMVIDTDRMRPAARRRHRRSLGPGHPSRRGPRHLAGAPGDVRGPHAGRCRSSGSGECARAATPSSSSPPARARSRSARPSSTTRRRPCGCCASCAELLEAKGFAALHRRRRRRPRPLTPPARPRPPSRHAPPELATTNGARPMSKAFGARLHAAMRRARPAVRRASTRTARSSSRGD